MHSHSLRNFLLGLVGAVVFTALISLFTAVTATPRFYYSVTDLGTLTGYQHSVGMRINDLGQVVGYSYGADFQAVHAFVWQNGTITDLGTLGGNESTAWGINNAGQVVGRSLISSERLAPYHAFIWQNGTMTDLGTDGNDDVSGALGINNSRQVVGWSETSNVTHSTNTSTHAVLWQNGGITDLGTLSGDNVSRAYSINNRGQVFGESFNMTNNTNGTIETIHIFRWQNGVMTNLGSLVTPSGYIESQISDINSKGQVVGRHYSGSPFMWQNGTLTELGNLGGIDSWAYSINEVGTVVGGSWISANIQRAFIWRNGRQRDLNNLLPPNSGWELESANGINNTGQIVGSGKLNGQYRGFLLTPVTVSN